MSVHDYHEAQPGYSASQILHDGCGECEARGKDVSRAIGSMDKGRFALAWRRAADWNTGSPGFAYDVSQAERPVLDALWAVQLKLESVCGLTIGELP